MFSTFDLKSAYHEISRIESDRKYKAFETNGKLYEFTGISLSVKNGVAEFQRKMREFIEEENLNGAFSYVDNITIAGHDQADHDRKVAYFVYAIQRRKFKPSSSETISFVKSLNILGYIASNMKIRPDPEHMCALLDFPVPNNKNALRLN